MGRSKKKRKILLILLAASAVFASGCISSDKSEETTKTTEIVTETETAGTSVTETAAETFKQEMSSFKWETGKPQEHGLEEKKLEELHDMLKGSETFSMLTVKDGVIVDEFYNDGYSADSTFPFHSCSKSVTGTLIGIALEQGYIDSIDDPISKYIKQAQELSDKRKGEITIRNLLTNESGLDWDEWNSYDVWNQFRSSPDWVEFILGRELVYDPGTHFTYSTGNTHLLSALLQSATGKNQLEYAREVLFDPLGMESVAWDADPQGITDGGNGIVMTPRDAARFGQMCLQNGVWQEKQIVLSEWLRESVTPKNSGYEDLNGSYGYQWWMRDYKGYDMYYAYGFGGQYIFIVPELDLVNVITGNNPSQSYKARECFTEYLLDALV